MVRYQSWDPWSAAVVDLGACGLFCNFVAWGSVRSKGKEKKACHIASTQVEAVDRGAELGLICESPGGECRPISRVGRCTWRKSQCRPGTLLQLIDELLTGARTLVSGSSLQHLQGTGSLRSAALGLRFLEEKCGSPENSLVSRQEVVTSLTIFACCSSGCCRPACSVEM